MSRDPSAVSKARKAEAKDSIIKIKPLSTTSATSSAAASSSAAAGKAGGGSGFKKGGFKNAFAPAGGGEEVGEVEVEVEEVKGRGEEKGKREDGGGGVRGELEAETEESGSEDDGLADGERYDPRRPTGCWEGCPGRSARVG